MPRTFRWQSATKLENKRKNQPSSGHRLPRYPEKRDFEVLWSMFNLWSNKIQQRTALRKQSEKGICQQHRVSESQVSRSKGRSNASWLIPARMITCQDTAYATYTVYIFRSWHVVSQMAHCDIRGPYSSIFLVHQYAEHVIDSSFMTSESDGLALALPEGSTS